MGSVKSHRRGSSLIRAYQRGAKKAKFAKYGTKELVKAERAMAASASKLKRLYNIGLRKGHNFNVGGFLRRLERRA